MAPKGLKERLAAGETLVLAEGYLLEFERRGYLKAGSYVPEVVLEHPEMVKALHEEYVHAGSDIVEAFTLKYYAHREKLRLVGREAELEPMNRKALRMAKEVATATDTLMAGNICNSTTYNPNDPKTIDYCREMFKESVTWAREEGADLIIAETMLDYGEAMLALEAIKQYAPGTASVVSLAPRKSLETRDGLGMTEALTKLANAGADVVGVNCALGPVELGPFLPKLRAALPHQALSAVPVPYRTHTAEMYQLKLPHNGQPAFPSSLDYFYVSEDQIRDFGRACLESDVQLVGLCCGNSSHYTRALAESVGKTPPASRFTADMSKHFMLGNDKSFSDFNNIDNIFPEDK